MVKKVEKIELVCPVCQKVFYKNPSDIKNVKGKPCCCIKCKQLNSRKYKNLNISCSTDRLHHIWYGIIKRCYNKNNQAYKDYGGRGIKVFEQWKHFENFREWALNNGYKENLSIERIDVDGNYCPKNCTWIPMNEQNKNKRNTLYVIYNGEKTKLKNVALLENVDYKDLWQVFKRKQNIQEALKVCKLHNQGLIEANKSGVSGVSFYKNGWTVTYKKKYIGHYKTLNEAIKAKEDFINRYYNKVT